MAIVDISQLREHLSLDDDSDDVADLVLLHRLIASAQNHIEQTLGFRIEDEFGGDDQDPIPPALSEAVCLLAAWWHDQREAAVTGASANAVPFGVNEIIENFREYSF